MKRKAQSERETVELKRDEHGLALVQGKTVVRGDFTRMLARLKAGNLNRELLVRAAKVRRARDAREAEDATTEEGGCTRPLAVDATAGLGEDSLLLAAAGFRVLMFERNPTIAALLQDALERAASAPELADIVARMQLTPGDSIEALPRLPEQPDVVLLDPMFPDKHNRAAAKKKLHMLQQLEDPCGDERALLDAAFAAQPRKIVVKRPVKGPHLAGYAPSYALSGKAIRFDCIVVPRT